MNCSINFYHSRKKILFSYKVINKIFICILNLFIKYLVDKTI